MKYFISLKALCILGLITLLPSCDNYLEVTPDNRVELNTLEKAAQLLTNGYSYASYSFTEWMGDLVAYTLGTSKQTEHNELYAWEDPTAISQDTPTFFWTSTYEAIAHANEVLAVVDELPGEEGLRQAVKAEALLIRAYGHFMLVNLFAKHYDEASAATDLGIPYVEEPETVFIKQYDRNTIAEVYDNIERDMLEGIANVSNAYYANSGKYHFNRNAALALASRFYLFKGDYEKCIEYSSQMLGSNPDTYVKDMISIYQNRVNIENYIQSLNSPDEEANLLLVRQLTNFPLTVGFWPNSAILNGLYDNNLFGEEDIRGDPAYLRGENGLTLTRFEFLFERSSLTSNVGYNYTIILALRGEEVVLNRAESYIMQNRLAEAVADLRILALKRYGSEANLTLEMLQNYYNTNGQEACLRYLRTERMKEFMHEGLRWFDIKRYDVEVEHTLEDGSTVTLNEDDPRKVLQIPEAAINVGGLESNPR